ncbi:hypothetical protein SAMN02745866_04227 [Alteromonadaceae bacterium Bs31]|nr:hypothetical protein SAMN02745866_04227 [Alteromonadaceae bacterium Bs31]
MFTVSRKIILILLFCASIINCSGGSGSSDNKNFLEDTQLGAPPSEQAGGEPAAPTLPAITAVDLVAAEAQGDLIDIQQVSNGDTIDLNTLASASINFSAVPDDMALVNSVEFTLTRNNNATPIIDRYENNPPFTAASDTLHIAIDSLATGNYQLAVTPYSEEDKAGEKGTTYQIEFSIVALAGTTIVANNDYYQTDYDTAFNSSNENSVTLNDVFEITEAVFVVVQEPDNGSVVMQQSGQFQYTPASEFTGTDQFSYQIQQGGSTAEATVTFTVVDDDKTAPPFPTDTDNTGFTKITPSSDTRVIFVSDSVGDDNNTCLSAEDPCKTIDAGAKKMRAGYADHLRLKRGDTWFEQDLQSVPSGRSASEPQVVYFYGDDGKRPNIESSTNTLHKYDLKNVSFIGINFSAYTLISGHPEFTGNGHPKLFFLGPNHNIRFEDNVFDHFELVFQQWSDGRPENITLHRNIWTGSYANTTSLAQTPNRPSNLYAEGVEVLTITENIVDHGGWHDTTPNAGANMYNHNLYIQAGTDGNKLLLENNIITRASSHGAQLRQGGLARNNFFGRNAIGLLLGYNKVPLPAGTRAYMFDNVASEGHSMIKGDNACAGPNLCTPALWGLEFDRNGPADYQTKNNIVSNTAPNDTDWQGFYNGLVKAGYHFHGDESQAIQASGNIEWNWSFDGQGAGPNYKDPGRTLGDYNESLGGKNSFDEFMETALNRPLQTWDERYTADKINAYIRAGFELVE